MPLGAQRNHKIWVIGGADSGVASQNVAFSDSSGSVRARRAWNLEELLSLPRNGVNLGLDTRAARIFAHLCARGLAGRRRRSRRTADTKKGESTGCTVINPEVYTIPGHREGWMQIPRVRRTYGLARPE